MLEKNKLKGDLGEELASKYINKIGCKIIQRNFRCNMGEIDVIFKDKNELVFGEIKTRLGTKCGFPAEAVTYFKRKHILNSARFFLNKYKISNVSVRFDVIEVYINKLQKPVINHIKNVFW